MFHAIVSAVDEIKNWIEMSKSRPAFHQYLLKSQKLRMHYFWMNTKKNKETYLIFMVFL